MIMANYLDPKVIAKAQALGVKARTLVEGLRVGDHKSPYRGFSVEFVQHREYVPGDDIRHIDWKGYGRSERYTIKQYEQETNFTAHLMIDASKSMQYGEGDTNKLEYVKTLTAALAYLIIHQRDSVALDIFDAGWCDRLPPSGQMGHVQTILNTLVSVQPRDKNAMGPLLHDIANQVRRRGLFFLISDCFDDVESILGGLQHLRFGGHEVVVFHILHPDELDFPFNGMVKFEAMEEKMHLLTRPQLIRPTYLRALKKYIDDLQTGCERNRCDYVQMNTARPLAEALTEYLARRLRTRVV
jgi:uncharacterized protein (DUF58 family)